MAGISLISIIWIFLVHMRMTPNAARTPTKLFSRCSRYEEGHDCLQYQDSPCTARKISDEERGDLSEICSDACPGTPTNLQIAVYKERRFIGGQMFTGANVSWTIPPGEHRPRGFIAEFISGIKIFVVFVNITQSSDAMEFNYDCFYPIIPGRTWTVTIQNVPYDNTLSSHNISAEFTLDSNGDRVFREVTTTSVVTATRSGPTLTSTSKTLSATMTTPITRTTPTTTTDRPSTPGSNLTNYYGITIGILCAVLFLGSSLIIVYVLRQQWEKIRKGNCMKGDQSDGSASPSITDVSEITEKPAQANGLLGGSSRRVLMVYIKTGHTHIAYTNSLMTSLSDLFQLTDVNTLQSLPSTECVYVRHTVEQELKKTDVILLVSSDHLIQATHDLTNGSCSADGSTDLLALDILIKSHALYRAKIITAYFPLAKDLRVLQGYSRWAPVALPINMDMLQSHIQDPDSSPLMTLELPESRYHDFDSNIGDYEEKQNSFESGFCELPNWDQPVPVAAINVPYTAGQCYSQPEVALHTYGTSNQHMMYPYTSLDPQNLHAQQTAYSSFNRSQPQRASLNSLQSQSRFKFKPPRHYESFETINESEYVADLNAKSLDFEQCCSFPHGYTEPDMVPKRSSHQAVHQHDITDISCV